MNYKKLLNQIVSDNLSNKAWHNQELLHNMLYSNEHMIAAVPLDKAIVKAIPVGYLEKAMNEENQYYAVKLNELYTIHEDKKEIRVFENEKIGKVYIDNKLMMFFDKDAEYLTIKKNSPVYVYENNYLVGLVLPIRKD